MKPLRRADSYFMSLAFRLFIFTALFCGEIAHAEYRVFQLRIFDPATGSERSELSTLDPEQYPRYYPLRPGEKISYTQTWRCYGSTAEFKPYCPNPKENRAAASDQGPSSAAKP